MTAAEIATTVDDARRHPGASVAAGRALVALADLVTERIRRQDAWNVVARRFPMRSPVHRELAEATTALMRAEDDVRAAVNYTSHD